jgi:hypothetical protein
MRYNEEEVAAEEERLGAKLPDDLRERYLSGVADTVILRTADGEGMDFGVLGPSTTDSETQGREYPTTGMTRETHEVREMMGEFFPDDILVAWGADGTGDLAVVGGAAPRASVDLSRLSPHNSTLACTRQAEPWPAPTVRSGRRR